MRAPKGLNAMKIDLLVGYGFELAEMADRLRNYHAEKPGNVQVFRQSSRRHHNTAYTAPRDSQMTFPFTFTINKPGYSGTRITVS